MLELGRTLPTQIISEFGHFHPVLPKHEGSSCILVKLFSSMWSVM